MAYTTNMRKQITHSALPSMKPLSVSTYVISLTVWLALCFGVMAIVVDRNIQDVEKNLKQYGDAYSDHLDKQLVSSNTILKGFSALFSAIGSTSPAKAARYARQVIETNPQVYALEIVQTVEKNQLAAFIGEKRREGIAHFSVKSFSFDAGRQWQPLIEKPRYYPITFMEPMSSGSENVLGLDIGSVPFLHQAMSASRQRGAPVASHPFRLVEGNLAYVVFCPITQNHDASVALTAQNGLVVDVVIDASKLAEPEKFPVTSGETVRIYHKDFSANDPKGQLLAMSGRARSVLETALFPNFVYQKSLATMGEPFTLQVTQQVGWSDLSLALLALLAILSLLSSLILLAYLRAHQQSRILQIENQQRLWQHANHDALTGLPNRMLMLDRLTQLLARMQREEKRLAVMFLDLDGFKRVNDTHGHAVGDQLLMFAAERLQATIRGEDTVARISGDEFIIVIEHVESQAALNAIRQKIRQKLDEGFLLNGHLIRVKISIGIATYPKDGDSPEALIKQADMRMYADKKTAQQNTTRP